MRLLSHAYTQSEEVQLPVGTEIEVLVQDNNKWMLGVVTKFNPKKVTCRQVLNHETCLFSETNASMLSHFARWEAFS